MKAWKKLTAWLLAAALAGFTAVPAMAAEERTKIEKVGLTFTAVDYGDETSYGEVEVDTASANYYVDDVEFLSSTSGSKYPRVKVTLYAEDDYYFGSNSKSAFELSGEGAYFSSASLRDSRSCVVVTVQLRDYSGAEADVPEDVEWDYEGSGTWSEIYNAAYYEVRLKRGSSVVGDIIQVYDTTFNFANMITQTGNYSFQVRSVNQYVTSNKSKWVSSERWTVDSETLDYVRGNAVSTSGPSGATTGWQLDSVGYWYRNYDGTYPAACWQQINGVWYYFNPNGYMAANQWILHSDGNYYYVGPDGAMWTNARTPDGYYVDASGIWRPGL